MDPYLDGPIESGVPGMMGAAAISESKAKDLPISDLEHH